MNNQLKVNPKILCYGEILHDIYSKKKVIAGAPLHVAVHLAGFARKVYICSSIGNDKEGHEIIDYLKEKKVYLNYIEKHKTLPTGYTNIVNKKSSTRKFKIGEYSAWDEIRKVPDFLPDVLYIGTLSSRYKISRKTLKNILKKNIKIIFLDINLREPFINTDDIDLLLSKATHLKLNCYEYNLLKSLNKNKYNLNQMLISNKSLKFIALTKGKKGSEIFTRNGRNFKIDLTSIKNRKIVGAGDAFSAGLIEGLLSSTNDSSIHNFASSFTSNFINKAKSY